MTTNDFSPGHVPHLEPGEAPWTEAELQIREKLLAEESVPPASLEADIWDSMGRPSGFASSGRVVALAVAGGLAALAWFWPADVSETRDVIPSPTVQEPVANEESMAPVVLEAETDDALEVSLSEPNPSDVLDANSTPSMSTSASGRMSKQENGMTSIKELEISELEGGNAGERFPLKLDTTPTQQELREAILEVKQ